MISNKERSLSKLGDLNACIDSNFFFNTLRQIYSIQNCKLKQNFFF